MSYDSYVHRIFPNLSLFLISLYLLLEVFIFFKIGKTLPKIVVSKNNGENILESLTIRCLGIWSHKKLEDVLKNLLKTKSVNFMLGKIDASASEIKLVDVSKEEVLKKSLEVAKNINVKYITTSDIFVAYLLLTEQYTKFLFNKKIKEEEMLHILYWSHVYYSEFEESIPIRINFWGKGIAEDWVSGWTLETKKYTLDISSEIAGKKPMLLGREKEFKECLEGLLKNKSLILVGDPGSGKDSLVDSLAFESFIGELSGGLNHKRFLQLMVDSLLAGAKDQGELEKRLNEIIAELVHAREVILYVPNFENVLGSSAFKLDLSGALSPYLDKGQLQIITTITPGAYKKFVETKSEFLNSFDVIKLENPDNKTALEMLFERAAETERYKKISLSYRAITAALAYAPKYSKDKVLPGSSVNLLEDSIGAVLMSGKKTLEEQDVLNQVERKTQIAVGQPKEEEKKLLLNLENEIHKRIIDQEEAVSAIAEAIRRIRGGLVSKDKPISFLFLGPTGVGKTETAKALASIYFKGEDKMIRLDMSEYQDTDGVKRLLGSVPGEGDEKGELTEKVYDNPFSLVLLDEFEKANPKIMDLFLQVLDDGRLTDNKGKTVSFSDTIIIATSNAASEFIREKVKEGQKVDKNFQEVLYEFLQSKGILKPELLNRFDSIIVFKPLGKNEVSEIVKLLLKSLEKRLDDQGITVSFDQAVLNKIGSEGFDEQFGARPLRRFIQDKIEDIIAQKIISGDLTRGDKIKIIINQDNRVGFVSSN
jgi:ATP-dependent Clp protease ATP-binding subunit ClpC